MLIQPTGVGRFVGEGGAYMAFLASVPAERSARRLYCLFTILSPANTSVECCVLGDGC